MELTTQEKVCKLTRLVNELKGIDFETKWAREIVGAGTFELGKLIAQLQLKAAGKLKDGQNNV